MTKTKEPKYYFVKYKGRALPTDDWTEDCMLMPVHPTTWLANMLDDYRGVDKSYDQTVIEFYAEVSRHVYYKNKSRISIHD